MKKKYSIEELQRILNSKNIKPSIQRLKILEMLLLMGHPSVDDIYKALIDEIPTLSKTTVYNTLNLFIEKGLAQSFSLSGDPELRYELIENNPHAHFRCIKCGEIYDIELDCDIFKKREIDGFKISKALVFFEGVCKKCQLKNSLDKNS